MLFSVLAGGAFWKRGKSTRSSLQSATFFRFADDARTQDELNFLESDVSQTKVPTKQFSASLRLRFLSWTVFTIETSASAALNGSVALYASEVGKLFCGLTFAVTGPRLTSFGTPLRVRRLGSMVIVSSG